MTEALDVEIPGRSNLTDVAEILLKLMGALTDSGMLTVSDMYKIAAGSKLRVSPHDQT